MHSSIRLQAQHQTLFQYTLVHHISGQHPECHVEVSQDRTHRWRGWRRRDGRGEWIS